MKKNKPKCHKCESSQNYFRQESQDHVCRICGYIWKKTKEVKNATRQA